MDYTANTPVFKTPLTDFSHIFGTITVQRYGSPQCKRFELQYLDCMDAYGVEKGSLKCIDVFHDFFECIRRPRQEWRFQQMSEVRAKKIKEGKLEKKYMESPPPEIIYPVHY